MKAARRRPDATRPPAVVYVNPGDGATGVFCDSPVAVRISTALDPRTVNADTLRVQEASGPVPGRLALCGDAHLIVFHPARFLTPDILHFVIVSGLVDRHGRSVRPHCSRFIPCGLGHHDLFD